MSIDVDPFQLSFSFEFSIEIDQENEVLFDWQGNWHFACALL